MAIPWIRYSRDLLGRLATVPGDERRPVPAGDPRGSATRQRDHRRSWERIRLPVRTKTSRLVPRAGLLHPLDAPAVDAAECVVGRRNPSAAGAPRVRSSKAPVAAVSPQEVRLRIYRPSRSALVLWSVHRTHDAGCRPRGVCSVRDVRANERTSPVCRCLPFLLPCVLLSPGPRSSASLTDRGGSCARLSK